jgi:hypothetical protein
MLIMEAITAKLDDGVITLKKVKGKNAIKLEKFVPKAKALEKAISELQI